MLLSYGKVLSSRMQIRTWQVNFGTWSPNIAPYSLDPWIIHPEYPSHPTGPSPVSWDRL